eukprot:TRINITY_DN4279_c1_g1_i4.p1 TRINITY_DN4279_c1_g1~~TRINITY_DN4279_c1_g1_i4.p1  ORF type:complete len:316 (+),score=91.21 TRINITY_DN4279_c1_g1_i4:379-1326(+)
MLTRIWSYANEEDDTSTPSTMFDSGSLSLNEEQESIRASVRGSKVSSSSYAQSSRGPSTTSALSNQSYRAAKTSRSLRGNTTYDSGDLSSYSSFNSSDLSANVEDNDNGNDDLLNDDSLATNFSFSRSASQLMGASKFDGESTKQDEPVVVGGVVVGEMQSGNSVAEDDYGASSFASNASNDSLESFTSHEESGAALYRLFNLPPSSEQLVEEFPCLLSTQNGELRNMAGKLYITTHYLCFHHEMSREVVQEVIPFSDVGKISKADETSIQFSINGVDNQKDEFVFSFESRDEAYQTINRQREFSRYDLNAPRKK